MLRSVTLAASILAGFSAPVSSADLEVTVTGARPATGQVLLSVFDRAEDWMTQPVASRSLAIGPDGAAVATFALAPGAYAIALTHDANANGRIDTNALGIPTEAFGFSNGARARFGPPAFRKAAFALTEPGALLSISLDRTNR